MNRKWGRQKTTGLWMMVIGGGMCLFAFATLASRGATEAVKAEPIQAVKLPSTDMVENGEAVEIYLGSTRCYIQPVRIGNADYFLTTSNCTLTYKGWH
ncbi:hypothetical protein EVB87_191 [Rhizobium phage RHph_N28_1]|nr:hypothetical protein EVB87_191 [Rhizobium phage RHph_N28_1]QIG74220.1 hypothetical protein EVC07_192 [Rhizobium phage RHph_N42]